MSKIKLFLKRIGRFFDKKLITPLSKLFVKINELLKSNNKKFEALYSKKSSLVIISLFMAVGIFLYVDDKSTTISETSAEVLYNQKVNAIYNAEAYVIEGIPETVDVTMIGRKSDLYLAKQLPVDAVDIDPESVRVTTKNIRENQVSDRIQTWQSDGYEKVTRTYDLIFANILARPLMEMAPDLFLHLNPGGYAILSGFLNRQQRWVMDAHKKAGLTYVAQERIKEWGTLLVKRN